MNSYIISISTLILLWATTVNSQGLMCFDCRSNPRHPRNCPIDGQGFSRYTVSVLCKGSCYSMTSKYEPNVVHRGCSPDVPNYVTGCHITPGGTWCYCSHYLCNIRNMEIHMRPSSLSSGHPLEYSPPKDSEHTRCFNCNSDPRYPLKGCSIRGFMLKDSAATVLCKGTCYTKTDKTNPAIVHRGCLPEKIKRSGCQSYKGETRCVCHHSLCNDHDMGIFAVQSMGITCKNVKPLIGIHSMGQHRWKSFPKEYFPEDEHTNPAGTYVMGRSRALPTLGKTSSQLLRYLLSKFKTQNKRDGQEHTMCYKCRSDPSNPSKRCPLNGKKIEKYATTVSCKGSCYSKTSKANPAIVHRGCYPGMKKFHEHKLGFGCHIYKGDIRCFCDHFLCNYHNMERHVTRSFGLFCSMDHSFDHSIFRHYHEDEYTNTAGNYDKRHLIRALPPLSKTPHQILKYLLGKFKSRKSKGKGEDESLPEDNYEAEAKEEKPDSDWLATLLTLLFMGG